MKTVDYANKYLFEPLGIKKHTNYLAETAQDMAKIGLLCLDSGNVIYINPEKNIVVSVASYFKPTVFDRGEFI